MRVYIKSNRQSTTTGTLEYPHGLCGCETVPFTVIHRLMNEVGSSIRPLMAKWLRQRRRLVRAGTTRFERKMDFFHIAGWDVRRVFAFRRHGTGNFRLL